VNPEHLRFGTVIENDKDRWVAGTATGVRHYRKKLTGTDIPIIRKLAESWRLRDIAKILGIGVGAVALIVAGRHWAHIIGVATDQQIAEYLCSKWTL
jgi:hypothetical protein